MNTRKRFSWSFLILIGNRSADLMVERFERNVDLSGRACHLQHETYWQFLR